MKPRPQRVTELPVPNSSSFALMFVVCEITQCSMLSLHVIPTDVERQGQRQGQGFKNTQLHVIPTDVEHQGQGQG